MLYADTIGNNTQKWEMMRVIYPLLITILLLAGFCWLAWVAELQSTVIFVLDKGGLYLNYTAGFGRLRVIGFRVRLALGHGLRAWKRNILTGKYEPETFDEIYRRTTRTHWNTLQIPYRSILNLGIQVIIKKLNVDAKVGLEDNAAATALLCGLLSAFLHALRAAGAQERQKPDGHIAVKPAFGKDCLSIRLRCIVAIEVRQAAHILAKSFGRAVKTNLQQ